MATLTFTVTWPDQLQALGTFSFERDPDWGSLELSGDGASRLDSYLAQHGGFITHSPWAGSVSGRKSWVWLQLLLDRLVEFAQVESIVITGQEQLPPVPTEHPGWIC